MKREKIDKKAINDFFHLSNRVLRIFLFLLIVLLILVVTYIVKEWQIFSFIKTLLLVISPVFIGFIIAWLLDPLATRLSKKMPRVVACILAYVIFFSLIVLLFVVIVPSFSNGMSEIINTLPKIVENLQNMVNDFFANFKDNSLVLNYKDDISKYFF